MKLYVAKICLALLVQKRLTAVCWAAEETAPEILGTASHKESDSSHDDNPIFSETASPEASLERKLEDLLLASMEGTTEESEALNGLGNSPEAAEDDSSTIVLDHARVADTPQTLRSEMCAQIHRATAATCRVDPTQFSHLGVDDEFDDRTLLDIFGEVAKDYLTHKVVSAVLPLVMTWNQFLNDSISMFNAFLLFSDS